MSKPMQVFRRLVGLIAVLTLQFVCLPLQAAGALKLSQQSINETKPTHEIKIVYPRTGHAAIDKVIEPWAKALAKDFAASAREAKDDMRWSAELAYEVPRNDGVVLSLVFSYYNFTGGAHPNSSSQTFHFLLPDGYSAEISEIFSPRGIKRISDISISELKREMMGPDGMGDADWIKRGAGPNARNFSSFALLAHELVVYFDAYQVAPYAAGPQEIHIPIAKLRDTMRPDARAPAASFECRQARSAVEQAVCSSRDLAALDRHMGEAYQDKLSWAADEAAADTLRKQQRAWLKLRDTSCQAARMPLVACLTPLYQKRLKELSGD